MQTIIKKTWNPDFKDIDSGEKKFDIRLYDRVYETPERCKQRFKLHVWYHQVETVFE